MTDTTTSSAPDWLENLGVSELKLSADPVMAGGELHLSVAITPPPSWPIALDLWLTYDAWPVVKWAVAAPAFQASFAIPGDIRPGPYELVLRRDDWELDVIPLMVETAGDVERSKTYDRALSASAAFTECLREQRLEEAYDYADAAATAYATLNSPAAAADLLRECASALLTVGSVLAADAAFKAFEFYQVAGDDLSAKSARHLLMRALQESRAFQPARSTRPVRVYAIDDSTSPEIIHFKSTKHSVFIVGDDPQGREHFKALVQEDPQFEVVGESAPGAAFQAIVKQEPDIALFDSNPKDRITLPVINRLSRYTGSSTKIVLITGHRERQTVLEALRRAVSGNLSKSSAAQDFVDKIAYDVTGAGIYVSSGPLSDADLQSLSVREREVLRLLASGVNMKQIAEQLSLSPRTVESHKKMVLRKLGSPNIAALVQRFGQSSAERSDTV